jgi:hypothetical protein
MKALTGLGTYLVLLMDLFAAIEITGLKHPESGLFVKDMIYITEMGEKTRGSNDKDGRVARYFLNGKNDERFQFQGQLTNPMGMAYAQGVLYIADYDRVIGVSTRTGEVVYTQSLALFGANFVNDLVIVDNRFLICTDSALKKIFKIDLSSNIRNVQELNLGRFAPIDLAPNGLYYDEKNRALYLASNGKHALGKEGNGYFMVFRVQNLEKNQLELLVYFRRGKFFDGVVKTPFGVMISDWGGYENDGVLHVFKDFWNGNRRLYKKIKLGTKGLADIDFHYSKRILLAPDLLSGKVRLIQM